MGFGAGNDTLGYVGNHAITLTSGVSLFRVQGNGTQQFEIKAPLSAILATFAANGLLLVRAAVNKNTHLAACACTALGPKRGAGTRG